MEKEDILRLWNYDQWSINDWNRTLRFFCPVHNKVNHAIFSSVNMATSSAKSVFLTQGSVGLFLKILMYYKFMYYINALCKNGMFVKYFKIYCKYIFRPIKFQDQSEYARILQLQKCLRNTVLNQSPEISAWAFALIGSIN